MVKNAAISLALAACLCFPITGFVAGLFLADVGNSGPFGQVYGRMFLGCIFAVLNSVFLGSPPRNEGGVGEPYHLFFYSLATGVVLFGLFYQHFRSRH